METLLEKVRAAKRVYLIGNGGSYANTIHWQNDLEACGIRAHTLNPASLTASANDHGYEFVFSRWIAVHGEPGDLLIALSGSGRSPNILDACEVAHRLGMNVHRIFGAELGQDMQTAENHQLVIGHELYRALKK